MRQMIRRLSFLLVLLLVMFCLHGDGVRQPVAIAQDNNSVVSAPDAQPGLMPFAREYAVAKMYRYLAPLDDILYSNVFYAPYTDACDSSIDDCDWYGCYYAGYTLGVDVDFRVGKNVSGWDEFCNGRMKGRWLVEGPEQWQCGPNAVTATWYGGDNFAPDGGFIHRALSPRLGGMIPSLPPPR